MLVEPEALGPGGRAAIRAATETAQAARWAHFQKTLSVEHLRAHLKRLADFEDFEAEQTALEAAATETALAFFISWPSFERADRLVRERGMAIDGGDYETLRPAAEALEETFPAAATLLYRRMVEDVLDRAPSKQYPYAARDLRSCIRLADRGPAEPVIETHASFMARLQKPHGRKHGFRGLMAERPS